ncbi:hypothetical protein GCM10017044_23860 [Kordiimonas sediminis]|uniref:chorismate mutase n=1 Tax=Kordiimonas sediminis TaxID=1735581 RepID=A0A919AXK1_9PROT|nr:chorismate mutase [Kordiimonas sediminis]GHF27921.1 hypothetical protein GCM10017044_23860 [Kordiimonas sediminis]
MKTCQNMNEVREEIDALDREIVPLLLKRLHYINEAGRIKADRNTVRDSWRVEDVVSKAIATARKEQGNEQYIEDIYRNLIEWSINHEYSIWDKEHSD